MEVLCPFRLLSGVMLMTMLSSHHSYILNAPDNENHSKAVQYSLHNIGKINNRPDIKNAPDSKNTKEGTHYFEHDPEVMNNLPDTFDPRDKWPYCGSLSEIRDQGKCGACWAIAPAQVMTDRVCIQSGGKKEFHFSAEDILSCTRSEKCNGCKGGDPIPVWKRWQTKGYVSGGIYNSNAGCKPYSIPNCPDHMRNCLNSVPTPECKKDCRDEYPFKYVNDRKHGKRYYKLRGERNIMAELFTKGPVVSVMHVYNDLADYKSGVYRHVYGNRNGSHVVKLMGWGVDRGTKYWLVANSWGTDFGEQGFFKILRGVSECDIEFLASTADPVLEEYPTTNW